MVNDLLNERYIIVRVHYWPLLSERRLTIDNQRLSMVVDLESQISDVGRPGCAETPGFPAFQAGFGEDRRNSGGYKS
ncbi:hypothetical protein, partial [Rhizobium leguminosarum]|uniref:hypothetical protein n=1 Tax=Rhizobium leguminosarum TaxID=384 RepID=UPI001AEDB9AE